MQRHTNKLNMGNKAMSLKVVPEEDMVNVCGGAALPPIRAFNFTRDITWKYTKWTPGWVVDAARAAGLTVECIGP